MDISVIILTYNQKNTISRTLDSILAQEIDVPYEIIIGDDGSNDGTSEICEIYAKRHPDKIKYIRREKNGGLVNNYYDCLEHAKGKYIADCSGDDYWVNTKKLKIQYGILENRPEITLVGSDWLCEDVIDGKLSRASNACAPGEYEGKDLFVSLLTNKTVINLSSSLYRKNIIDNIIGKNYRLIRDKNLAYEDLQIIMACAAAGKIEIIKDVCLHYSVGHESVSNPTSFASRFRYTSKSVLQTMNLFKHFMESPKLRDSFELNRFFRSKGDYLLAMCYKSGPGVISSKELAVINKLPYGWKGVIYKLLIKLDNFRWPDRFKWIEGKHSKIKYIEGIVRNLANLCENLFIKSIRLPEKGVYTGPKRKEKIVLSMTSFPERINQAYYAIKSLMIQTIQADKIILWLSREQFPEEKLPPKFEKLKSRGLEIKFVEGDLRSHKKYFYALQNQKNDELTITYDDDLIYDRNSIERLVMTHDDFPRCVIVNRGLYYDDKIVEEDLLYSRLNHDEGVLSPSENIIPSTGAGCLYPYDVMPNTTFDMATAMATAPKSDDDWIWYNCLLKGTKIVKTRKDSPVLCHVFGSQKHSLGKINEQKRETQKVIKNLKSRLRNLN